MKVNLKGWYKKGDPKKMSEINWSGWVEGYFFQEDIALQNENPIEEWIMVKNYQELYIRDKALNCLGDVKNKLGLDVGGGDGSYSFVLSSLGAQMSVQDICLKTIEFGKTISKKAGFEINYVHGDAQKLKFEDKSFDFCIANDFFQAITENQKYNIINEMGRVLKPGGILIIKTPNLSYLKIVIMFKRILNLLKLKSPFIHIPHTQNNPDSEHAHLTTYSKLEKLLEENFFFNIQRVPLLIRRDNFPRFLSKFLYGYWPFTPHIVISCRRSIFIPLGETLKKIAAKNPVSTHPYTIKRFKNRN